MDYNPCFSHLVMQRSFPTSTQQRPRRIETAPPKGTTLTTDVPLPQKCGYAPNLEEGHRWYVSFLSPHRSSQTVRTHL